MQPLLEAGEVHESEVTDPLGELRQEVAELREQLESLRDECRGFVSMIRSARIVFGSGPAPASQPSVTSDSDKWERIKAKVGGKMAQIIEALQLTGTANRTQLKNQTGGAMGTIDQAIYKLRDMGLVVKNGEGWSLKQ